jgi:hypothetical protein
MSILDVDHQGCAQAHSCILFVRRSCPGSNGSRIQLQGAAVWLDAESASQCLKDGEHRVCTNRRVAKFNALNTIACMHMPTHWSALL